MNGGRMRVMAAAIVLTASAVLMAGAGPAGATSSAMSSGHFRPRSDHEMVVTGGQRWSPTVTPTGYVTWGNPGIPGSSRIESRAFTRQRPLVRNQYRPLDFTPGLPLPRQDVLGHQRVGPLPPGEAVWVMVEADEVDVYTA